MSDRPIVLQTEGDRWRVSGELTMDSVAALLAKSVALPLPAAGVVDLDGVERADSAGVSLLLAWKRRAAAEGRALVFAGLPPTMRSLATLYGVQDLLDA